MRIITGAFSSILFSVILVGAIVAVAYFVLIKPAEDKVNGTVNAPGIEQARKLAECVAGAGGNLNRIKRCQKEFPLAPP